MRGLNKLYYLKKEIEEINWEIKNLPEISSSQMTGMPHSGQVSDPVFNLMLKKDKLVERLNRKIERYMDELIRIEDVIERIEDDEIRLMARMRFIKCMKWEDIGEKVHLDRTVCSRKVRRYLEHMGN